MWESRRLRARFPRRCGNGGNPSLDFHRFHTVAISTALPSFWSHVLSFIRRSLPACNFPQSAGAQIWDVFRSKTPRSCFMK
jgi:hypothetical protein